jgi:hypothetical protein
MIIPRTQRLTVYSILDNKIINETQKQAFENGFRVDSAEIASARIKCLDAMNDADNLHSFVYVHMDGRLETETNATKPKYAFHPDFNR